MIVNLDKTVYDTEAGGQMTDEKALHLLAANNDWLRRKLAQQADDGRRCVCGACFICAYNHLKERLAFANAIEALAPCDMLAIASDSLKQRTTDQPPPEPPKPPSPRYYA